MQCAPMQNSVLCKLELMSDFRRTSNGTKQTELLIEYTSYVILELVYLSTVNSSTLNPSTVNGVNLSTINYFIEIIRQVKVIFLVDDIIENSVKFNLIQSVM